MFPNPSPPPVAPTTPPPVTPTTPSPLSPTPGSKDYADLQLEIMKNTLASLPEPLPGRTRGLHPRTKQQLDTWTHTISHGEAQIRRLGPRIEYGLLRATLQCQFNRTLLFWRLFRLMDLPSEIISNILHLVVWSTPHPVKQRLRLTWVCRAWRRLMIEDPIIWNAIWFHEAPPYDRAWAWFERAGSARLDIRINDFESKHPDAEDPPKFTAEQMSDVLDKLFTKLPQIRMLVVVVKDWPPALTVLQKLQTAGNAGIPIHIERFEIYRSGTPYIWIGPGYDTQGHCDPTILFGGQTRQLRHLCLSGIHIDFDNTPLSNLTTLDLRHTAIESSPTLKCFRDILQNCPNLCKLTLDGCSPQLEERWFTHTPVELPQLKTLTLGSFSLRFACFAVAQIHAPRVRDLNLMNMYGSDYTPLIALLTRKFKQVRILTLYNVQLNMEPMGKQTFVRWLDSMPEIGYARLARINPEILNMFAEDPSKYRVSVETDAPARHALCPEFQCMEVQHIPVPAIAEFCRLRKNIGIPMKKLYLNFPWARDLTKSHVDLLRREVAALAAPPVGSNTEEEDRLLSER